MKFETDIAPHWLGALTVPTMMRQVLYAMAPLIAAMVYFFGSGVVINLIFASALCLIMEISSLALRGRNIRQFAGDGSALVTAFLIALALPPLTPWWVTTTACLFAIVFAKHMYGGLGYNPFNPAMVGYVVVLVSFPEQLAHWPGYGAPIADTGTTLTVFLHGYAAGLPDAVSGATPLDDVRIGLNQMQMLGEITQKERYGLLGDAVWQWLNLAALAGGIWLLYKKIIRWHVPIAMLGTLLALYALFALFAPASNTPALLGLFSGGTMLAAFFVATDPVSAASSNRGRLIFGAGIGLLIFVIRKWGAYPDGIGFAILLMNMAVPLIDRYTLPRVYGHRDSP